MTRIPINVIVIEQVASDASLDRQISKKVISYCETCGGIVFYQIVDFNYEGAKHATDTCIYCAQCGQLQGGIILDPLDEVQSGTAITTAEYEKLKEKAEKWDEVEPLLPKVTAHLLVEYLKKAAKSSVFIDEPSGDLNELRDKLEAVKEFVLSRREDIEKDIENFGMLRSILSYFLEEAERARPEGRE